jgi:hypothetical protein
MAARSSARRRPSTRADRPVDDSGSGRGRGPDGPWPAGLRWSCAIIFVVGLALVALGGWGLVRGTGRGSVVFGFGTSIVVGALLIVFAALMPWLADGPVRIGPLAVTLRLRARPPRGPRTRRAHRRRGSRRRSS